MHVYTLFKLKFNWVSHSEFRLIDYSTVALSVHVRIGIGLCVLRMLKISFGGCEPEVERDDSHVVVENEKQRFI